MMGLETRIADIARRILGEPNRQQSNRQTLRFGSNGSVAVDIAGPGAGQWFDHENGIGGGPWELIRVKARIADEDIPAWLEREIGIEREPRRGASNIAASYDYHDATGKLLFQVCRLKPKSFRQRRPDGNGGWQWSVKGVAMVPYRLPELAAARATGNGKPWRVYLCEGEKDCDRLRQQWRLIATTNPGGAGKWRAEYNQHFSGAEVIVLPDNDDAGRKHADQVAKALARIAVIVRIVELGGLPDKGDVSDWIDGGGSQSDLETLVELTEPYKPTAKGGPGGNPLTVSFRSGKESAMEAIEWLWPGWLARGKFHMLAGLKAAGKSTILFDLMARLTIGGEWPDRKPAPLGSVVIWSGEMGSRTLSCRALRLPEVTWGASTRSNT